MAALTLETRIGFYFITLTVIKEKFAMALKQSLHNHVVGYNQLVRQKQLRKALLQILYLPSLITKFQIQVCIRL